MVRPGLAWTAGSEGNAGRPRRGGWLVSYLAAVAAVAAVGSIATQSGRAWYDTLAKPAFTPPSWLFGPVWTALYIGMAVAAWLVHRSPGSRGALGAWWLQLALNLSWSWLFFGFKRPGLALLEIFALIAAVCLTMGLFARKSRKAAMVLVPYLAWACFAAALNFAIWRLNKA